MKNEKVARKKLVESLRRKLSPKDTVEVILKYYRQLYGQNSLDRVSDEGVRRVAMALYDFNEDPIKSPFSIKARNILALESLYSRKSEVAIRAAHRASFVSGLDERIKVFKLAQLVVGSMAQIQAQPTD